MALTLTKRGWNNVLILAVLAFISIFQFSHHRLFDAKALSSSPVVAEAVVMEVALPERRFQRIGSGWRSSDPDWQQERIESWLLLLQQPLPLVDIEPLALSEHIIQLHLLAQAEPLVLFWQPVQNLLYQANSKQAWQFDAAQAELLNQALTL